MESSYYLYTLARCVIGPPLHSHGYLDTSNPVIPELEPLPIGKPSLLSGPSQTDGPNYEKIEEFDHAGADGYDGSVEKTDSPLGMYAYVSTAPHFQRLQDNIAAAFTPRGGKTKAEKETEFKGETEKVLENLEETTNKEFKGFKDGEYQVPSFSDIQKNQAGENYFKKFGQ